MDSQSGNFRRRLLGMSLFGSGAALLILLIALGSGLLLQRDMEQEIVASSALRNHLEGDMMHDALNSDVLAALLTAAQQRGDEAEGIRNDVAEHAGWFRRTIEDNRKLPLSPEIKAAIEEVRPALEAYIEAAEQITELAFSAPERANAMMPMFKQRFEELESRNEKLSDLIQASLTDSEQALAGSQTFWRTVMILVGVAGCGAGLYTGAKLAAEVQNRIGGDPDYACDVVNRVASGDLATPVHVAAGGESSLLAAISRMQQNLSGVIEYTQRSLNTALPDMLHAAEETCGSMLRQSEENREVRQATQLMLARIADVSDRAGQTAVASQQAEAEVLRGEQIVRQAMVINRELAAHMGNAADVVRALNEGTSQIGQFLEVIRTIAEQTNLLALNAAIEAARAGDQGRGFAVVADEVRTLAQRTHHSTMEIEDIISRLSDSARQAVKVIETGQDLAESTVQEVSRSGEALQGIASAVGQIQQMARQIADAAGEHDRLAREVDLHVQDAQQLAERARDAGERTVERSHGVEHVVNQLSKMLAG